MSEPAVDGRPAAPAARRDAGFVGIPTFLRSRLVQSISELHGGWAVVGVPLDEGSPFAPGTRFGPRSIREHSLRFRPAGVFDCVSRAELLSEQTAVGELADCGDVDVLPGNPAATHARATAVVRQILSAGARPIVLGGNHSISFPVIRGFDAPLHVIQLDAHLDYMPVTNELEHTNGQGFRQIHGLPHVESLTQIGIRGFRNGASDLADAEAAGSRIVHVSDVRASGPSAVLEHVPPGARCYVSIDIDALDMPLVPGCASAEPDGLTFDELRSLLSNIAGRFDVRGFDLVEVNPMVDVPSGATSYLAAATVIHFLGQISSREHRAS